MTAHLARSAGIATTSLRCKVIGERRTKRYFRTPWRRRLRCSEITACALYRLIPIFWAFFPNFGQAVISNFNCLSISIKKKFCFIPNVTGTSAQTGQAVQFLRQVISIMKSGSHVCISKIVKESSLTVAAFTTGVDPRLDKRPLETNERLANRGLTSLISKRSHWLSPLFHTTFIL